MRANGVLIIGAGMAGLTAARHLKLHGIDSAVLDKGWKPGGRMATRTVGEARFDHGTQHFGIRDPEFRRIADEWMAAGMVGEWFQSHRPNPDGTPNVRHAGRGGMRRLAEHLAEGLTVHNRVRVTRLAVSTDGVVAFSGDGPVASGRAVIVTPPVPQTLELLDSASIRLPNPLRSSLDTVRYHACLAVMARLDGPPGLPAGHATPDGGPIAWIGDNEHKGVSDVPAVTIHSTPGFAADHFHTAADEWTKTLSDEAGSLLASGIFDAIGHRWRYSEPQHTLDIGATMADAESPVVLAGEVFAGARVEGAFLSGREAARRLLDVL